MHGELVRETTYMGRTEAEKDASCCAECSKHSQCEFWVRATDDNKCWLRANPGDRQAVDNRTGGYRGA